MLKNPFGIRNDEIIVVSSLTEEERGLKCNCVCPECSGKFEAKMGDIKIHHFAHTKDPCDETLAFIKGLFMFIEKMVKNEGKLYVPGLNIFYRDDPPASVSVTMDNIKDYVKIRSGTDSLGTPYKKHISKKGSDFKIDNTELKKNSKNRVEALVVIGNNKKQLAIRILPPPNVCKQEKPLPYENLSTLVCDAKNIDFYKDKEEEIFKELKCHNRWYWLENKKAEEFYYEIIKEINKKQQERIKEINKEQQEYQEWCQKTVNMNKQKRIQKTENRNEIKRYNKPKDIYPAEDKEEFRKCSICGETKNISEFVYYQSGISNGKDICRYCSSRRI